MTSSDDQAPVGFIGLGNMGAPIAKRLLQWPGGLVVCDMRPEAVAPFVEKGARSAATGAEVAKTARVISITVLNDAQVRDVIDGPEGILRTATKGTAIAVHSTISDTTAQELAKRCTEHGVHLVDAPVSGGAMGAAKGELATMVGASEEAFASVKDTFELWASLIVHAGPAGAGTRMKLARNLLHFITFTATAEAARLAEAAGVSVADLGAVVRHTDALTGGAGAIMYRETAGPLPAEDGWRGIFAPVRGLGEKDLSLALDLADRTGAQLPLAEMALQSLGDALGLGPGELANSRTNTGGLSE